MQMNCNGCVRHRGAIDVKKQQAFHNTVTGVLIERWQTGKNTTKGFAVFFYTL